MCFCGKTASQNTTRADFFSGRLLCYNIYWMNFPSCTESQDSLWCVLESTTVLYSTPLETKPHGAPINAKISSNIVLIILLRSMEFFYSCTLSATFYTFIIFTRYPYHLLIKRGHSTYFGTASISWSVRVMHLKTEVYILVQAPSVDGGMNVLAWEGVWGFL